MRAVVAYRWVLSVYSLLWICQMVTGHLTHSLIILIDSYINIYRILDATLGMIHLKSQQEARRARLVSDTKLVNLFGQECTFEFKRLPILGAFVNGLFLAALLMSAAIEGIQTCFHQGHTMESSPAGSILHRHPLTYPALLVSFAIVGAIMQWLAFLTHELRDVELESKNQQQQQQQLHLHKQPGASTLSPFSCNSNNSRKQSNPSCQQLSAVDLQGLVLETGSGCCNVNANSNNVRCDQATGEQPGAARAESPLSPSGCVAAASVGAKGPSQRRASDSIGSSHSSLVKETIAQVNCDSRSRDISLKSLRKLGSDENLAEPTKPEQPQQQPIPNHLYAPASGRESLESGPMSGFESSWPKRDLSSRVRNLSSPAALLVCAVIIYVFHEEMVTEITDAAIAILVVVVLYTASYPPMKEAGLILLQTAPDNIDVESLKLRLQSISPLITEIKELHIWSLTPRGDRVASCKAVLQKSFIRSDVQVSELLAQMRFMLQERNINCCTLEPVLA